MRILLGQAHPRDPTLGSPKSILRLAPALAALGHQVEYLFLDDVHPALRSRRLLYFTFPALLLDRVRRRKYDVVDISSGDAVLLGAIRRALPRSTPPIFNRILGLEHIHWAELKESARRGQETLTCRHRAWFGGVRLQEVELSIRLADHVLCLCEQDKRHVVDHGWRPPRAISVIPPGVDDTYLSAEPSSLDSMKILFLGTWTSRKGIHTLIDAFELVHAEVPAARLAIAGGHTPANRILAGFSPAVRSAVEVLPTLAENELLTRMRSCSLMAFPSLYEGFGIAFLEAMAVGLPVVATATGGVQDVVESGVNGELVPARDAGALANSLLHLLRDGDYRRRLGGAARATATQYTWNLCAKTTALAYSTLAEA